MFKRQLVHQSPRRAPKNRRVATRLQPTTPAQLVGLLAARRVCTHTSGDPDMRRASTWRREKETQTPSPSPDLIPAEHNNKTLTGNSRANWYIERGHLTWPPLIINSLGVISRGFGESLRLLHPVHL